MSSLSVKYAEASKVFIFTDLQTIRYINYKKNADFLFCQVKC